LKSKSEKFCARSETGQYLIIRNFLNRHDRMLEILLGEEEADWEKTRRKT